MLFRRFSSFFSSSRPNYVIENRLKPLFLSLSLPLPVVIWVTSLDNIVIVIIFLHSDFVFSRLNKQSIQNVHLLITCHCLYFLISSNEMGCVHKVPWRKNSINISTWARANFRNSILICICIPFHRFCVCVCFFLALSAFSKLKCCFLVCTEISFVFIFIVKIRQILSAYFKEHGGNDMERRKWCGHKKQASQIFFTSILEKLLTFWYMNVFIIQSYSAWIPHWNGWHTTWNGTKINIKLE